MGKAIELFSAFQEAIDKFNLRKEYDLNGGFISPSTKTVVKHYIMQRLRGRENPKTIDWLIDYEFSI